MQSLKFSIIIITWNGIHLLKKFLPSVLATDYSNFEIILGDNHSDDDTVSWIRQTWPTIKIVELDDNYGYAGGNNRAAASASGDILIFLNNDAAVEPNWLTPLNTMFGSSDADLIQPKLKSWKDPDFFEYAGAAGGYIDRLGYPFCRGRLFDTVEKDGGQYDQPAPLFWVSGAALAIRANIFSELGGFDEEFEFHMEEIDLCWRAHHAGYRCYSQPESVVYHLGGGSLEASNPRKTFYNYRNSLLMLVKNYTGNLFLTIFARLCLDGVSGIRSLLAGRPKETVAIFRSHMSFYGMLGSALKKRSAIQQKAAPSHFKSLIYPKLIIVDYFLKGKKTFSDLNFDPIVDSSLDPSITPDRSIPRDRVATHSREIAPDSVAAHNRSNTPDQPATPDRGVDWDTDSTTGTGSSGNRNSSSTTDPKSDS